MGQANNNVLGFGGPKKNLKDLKTLAIPPFFLEKLLSLGNCDRIDQKMMRSFSRNNYYFFVRMHKIHVFTGINAQTFLDRSSLYLFHKTKKSHLHKLLDALHWFCISKNTHKHTMPALPLSHVSRLLWILLLMVMSFTPTLSTYRNAPSVSESQARIRGYQNRGYKWPITEFVPNTPGWNKLMEDRLEQISTIETPSERFKGYATTLYSGLVIQNYTEYGFARTRISDSLLKELQQGIVDGFEDRVNEGYTPSITGNEAWHIQRDDLAAKVEEEMHEKIEEWGNTDLDLTYVYGLRLFRNTTTIKMHLDKKGSHALGYVLHVGASEDYNPEADPWPFLIEDLYGRTHEITMVPGDLIFFEGKC